MKRLAILLQDETGLGNINKCLENTGTNPKLVLRQHKVNKNDYVDIVLYDVDNDVNEPWPWEDSPIDKFGDGPYFVKKIYTNAYDGHRPLGYVGKKQELDKFEEDLKANFEILEFPWELRLVSIKK